MKYLVIIALALCWIASARAEAQTANGEQKIALKPGWNLISANRIPQFSNLTMILTDVNTNIVLLTKDGSDYYTPRRNQSGNWEQSASYSVFMNSNDTLNIYGDTVVLPYSIWLRAGENRIAYPKSASVSVASAFSQIASNLVYVSDGEGRFYAPFFGIASLEMLEPNRGYIVRVSADCLLRFE